MTNTFAALGLSEALLANLARAGHERPTAVQAAAIPAIAAGRDVIATAATGTGKTAAFVLPLIDRLTADRVSGGGRRRPAFGARILVLTPTRELASQIAEAIPVYGAGLGLAVAAVVGGQKMGPQTAALRRGLDILVATPGRLIDHIERGHCRLQPSEVLVLDEADQMLDLGFLPPIRRIAGLVGAGRQTLLFSATMPPAIRSLARALLRDPATISVDEARRPAAGIDQRVIHVARADKRAALIDLLAAESCGAHERVIVFARTRRGAERLSRQLVRAGIPSAAIHGDRSQAQRERALEGLRRGRVRVLVATDVAARGIDIPEVAQVVNFDLPTTPEAYIHRIGRTGRAGRKGAAVSLCGEQEGALLADIERLIGSRIPAEGRPLAAAAAPAAPRRGRHRSARRRAA